MSAASSAVTGMAWHCLLLHSVVARQDSAFPVVRTALCCSQGQHKAAARENEQEMPWKTESSA